MARFIPTNKPKAMSPEAYKNWQSAADADYERQQAEVFASKADLTTKARLTVNIDGKIIDLTDETDQEYIRVMLKLEKDLKEKAARKF